MKWLRALWRRFRRYRSMRIGEAPSLPRSRRVYLVEDDGDPWCAVMLCPCGCRETIYLSLLPEDRPSWVFTEHLNDTISLHPSVWRVRGCRSHFILRYGEIRWCDEDRSSTSQMPQTTRRTEMAKPKTTGSKAAKAASKTMTSKSTGSKSKTAAGSALSQTKAPRKVTSKKAASAASKVLRDGRTSKSSKSAAGSALAQKNGKGKKK